MFGKKTLQLLVIWDLLSGKFSCSAELSMKKVLEPRGLFTGSKDTIRMPSSDQ